MEVIESHFPENSKRIFDGERPECELCETLVNVALDDSTGLWLCEWCNKEVCINDTETGRYRLHNIFDGA